MESLRVMMLRSGIHAQPIEVITHETSTILGCHSALMIKFMIWLLKTSRQKHMQLVLPPLCSGILF